MYSASLNVSEGCSHGRCRYCSSYRYDSFRPLEEDVVEAEIAELAKTATALTKRVYLTGGNPFGLSNRRLLQIFDWVEDAIPTVNRYGGFCCIRDIANKSDEELRELAARGVDNITIGAESGLDSVLEFMDKGHTAADIVEQGRRLHEAGISFTFFYLAGLAGAGRGEENAIASARVFNEANPCQILVVTIVPVPKWPLSEEIASGAWAPATEEEMAREIQTFVAHLEAPCKLNCSHDSDIIRFEGMIPGDREKMVELLDHQIPNMRETSARKIRELLHGATF